MGVTEEELGGLGEKDGRLAKERLSALGLPGGREVHGLLKGWWRAISYTEEE
jgi:hypothetical protein